MTNTGTLTSNFGAAGGSRTLGDNLTNSGTVNIASNTSFDGSSALFDNKKTVAVTNGATLSTTGGQTFDRHRRVAGDDVREAVPPEHGL
jgi:hypothetical protein